jgi:hypothetical protein
MAEAVGLAGRKLWFKNEGDGRLHFRGQIRHAEDVLHGFGKMFSKNEFSVTSSMDCKISRHGLPSAPSELVHASISLVPPAPLHSRAATSTSRDIGIKSSGQTTLAEPELKAQSSGFRSRKYSTPEASLRAERIAAGEPRKRRREQSLESWSEERLGGLLSSQRLLRQPEGVWPRTPPARVIFSRSELFARSVQST